MLARRAGDALAFLLSDSLGNKPANHARCSLAYPNCCVRHDNRHIILARKRLRCLRSAVRGAQQLHHLEHLLCKHQARKA